MCARPPAHYPQDPPLCISPPSIHGEWFLLHCTCSPHYSLPLPPPSSISNPSLHQAAVSGPSTARHPSPFFSRLPRRSLVSLVSRSCFLSHPLHSPAPSLALLRHLIYALSPSFLALSPPPSHSAPIPSPSISDPSLVHPSNGCSFRSLKLSTSSTLNGEWSTFSLSLPPPPSSSPFASGKIMSQISCIDIVLTLVQLQTAPTPFTHSSTLQLDSLFASVHDDFADPGPYPTVVLPQIAPAPFTHSSTQQLDSHFHRPRPYTTISPTQGLIRLWYCHRSHLHLSRTVRPSSSIPSFTVRVTLPSKDAPDRTRTFHVLPRSSTSIVPSPSRPLSSSSLFPSQPQPPNGWGLNG